MCPVEVSADDAFIDALSSVNFGDKSLAVLGLIPLRCCDCCSAMMGDDDVHSFSCFRVRGLRASASSAVRREGVPRSPRKKTLLPRFSARCWTTFMLTTRFSLLPPLL